MSFLIRVGKYGEYWGDDIVTSTPLYDSTHLNEKQQNALYIYSYLVDNGWTLNAVAGLLGNMDYESTINPGRWQGDDVGNYSMGYGLVQWTPASKYTNWCATNGFKDPSEMDSNLARILYEVENDVQYYSTEDYPESFTEFTQSMRSAYYLACAFAWNYERSWVVLYGTEEEQEALRQLRGDRADYWFGFLSLFDPLAPIVEEKKKRKRFNFILFNRNRRRIF